MLFKIKENDILLLVEQFLESQHLLGALRSLEKESKTVLGNFDEDALFLRDLVMEGEWADVLEYLNPLRENTNYNKVRLTIEKQRYLELLATEKGSYDAGKVMKSLATLEDLCPTRQEYSALCYLLTRPHLTQHPAYSEWSVYKSRLACFESVHSGLLKPHHHSNGEVEGPSPGRLVDLLTKGLFYESALQLCSQKLAPGGCINITDALTDNLLTCAIADKEAILLHWLYEIPTSALVKPTNKKIVQVELEPARPPSSLKRRENSVTQSTDFSANRNGVASRTGSRDPVDVYRSIDRSMTPLSPLPASLLPQNGVEHQEQPEAGEEEEERRATPTNISTHEENPLEDTLGDSEVALNQTDTSIEDSSIMYPQRTQADERYARAEDELVTPLLQIEMGFNNTQIVDTKEAECQQDMRSPSSDKTPVSNGTGVREREGEEQKRGQGDMQISSTPELILSYTNQQEDKIRWLQKQLNELRVQQDSLRMSAALEKAGKLPSHASLDDPHTPTRPLYEHPSDLPGPPSDLPGPPSEHPSDLPGPPSEHACAAREHSENKQTEQGRFGDITHSAATDRGTGPDKKQATTASTNGWLEPLHSSLHTLESFSEDSLRPSKTSTPVKPVTCNRVADSSMLKVKFAPTAVLEDVQPIRCAAFHPNGELVAVGSNSKALRVCSCHMLSESVHTLVREDGCQDLPVLFKRNRHHRGSVYAVGWNTTGTLLASGSNDKSLLVVGFDPDNCISRCTDREFSFHQGTVRDIHFMDQSMMLSVGGGDNFLHLSDVEKGVEVGAYSGHTGTVHTVTSFRDTLVTGSEDATIRLWDRRTSACTRVIGAALGTQGKSGISSLSLNNFGNLMCASRDDGLCMLYDIDMGKLLAAFSPHTATTCRSVQFYRNPRYILSGSYDGTIALTCAEQVLLNPEINCTEILGTHRDKVTRVAWHPTKQAFVSCSADRTACLWTSRDGVDD